MKLSDCRKAEDEYSAKASDIARNLAFAGIALVWIFKSDTSGHKAVPYFLVWPTILIVSGLIVDLAHYLFAATYWALFVRRKESELVIDADTPQERFDEERQFTNPLWYVWLVDVLFYLKVGCVAVAYVLLFGFLLECGLFR